MHYRFYTERLSYLFLYQILYSGNYVFGCIYNYLKLQSVQIFLGTDCYLFIVCDIDLKGEKVENNIPPRVIFNFRAAQPCTLEYDNVFCQHILTFKHLWFQCSLFRTYSFSCLRDMVHKVAKARTWFKDYFVKDVSVRAVTIIFSLNFLYCPFDKKSLMYLIKWNKWQ